MRRYFGRKLSIYGLTFFVAVTVNWMIPRFMPGDPIESMVARLTIRPETVEPMREYFERFFGYDVPLWKQYLNFWGALLQGDLGTSVWLFPRPVTSVIMGSLPYTLGLLLPAILLSWWAGNKFGAIAARNRWLDNTFLPVGYLLTATPYMWLALVLAFLLAWQFDLFPLAGAYSVTLRPNWSWTFVWDLLRHWFLPFATLFIVAFGGWAIGMRNMIIYELEADYSRYLESLGAPRRLIRRYSFRNALLPQITGLALQLGAVVAGALVTEIVFSYPGLGWVTLKAVENLDFYLLQGVFLFIVAGVLVANFLIDVVYVLVDPRTRLGMQGRAA